VGRVEWPWWPDGEVVVEPWGMPGDVVGRAWCGWCDVLWPLGWWGLDEPWWPVDDDAEG